MRNFRTLYLVPFIIIFYVLSGCSSVKRENEEATKFLNFYIQEVLQKDTISLFENSYKHPGNDCLIKSIDSVKKSIPLNKQDPRFKWENIPRAKILKDTELPNRYTFSRSDFKKKYPSGLYIISQPVFSKDFNYVILHQGYLCGEMCGTGWIEMYQKTAKGWKQIKKYLCWIS